MGHVLIVDDDEFCRDYLRRVLERRGYEVSEAEDVQGALTQQRTHAAGVVITDYNLPDGNGVLLAQHLRESYAKVRLILITGGSTRNTVTQPPPSQLFDKVLQKPLPPDVLETTLNALLAS
jgi:DNA-binding NtrC family response regulator